MRTRHYAGMTALACIASVCGADPPPVPFPVGITDPAPIYYPNQNANVGTGLKPNWSTTESSKTPVYGMWSNAEHGIVQTGADRWLVVAMEGNLIYRGNPNPKFIEALTFLEYNNSFPASPTLPLTESGYWRGNTINSHPYVWAPYIHLSGGTYYLFYPALSAAGHLSCFLATSTTGNGTPGSWVQYDAVPGTPAVIDPLFQGTDIGGYRDFQIVEVSTPQGLRYYNYYIATPHDNALNVEVAEVRLRISDSLTNWPDSGEQATPAFRKVNVGSTATGLLFVDYENPYVVQTADGFYLFISRHGQLPPDFLTNPDYTPIPLSTEVYWSPDGLVFDSSDQLPNIKSLSGFEINSAEILHWNGRWFITDSAASNNPLHYPFDCCPLGTATPTEYSSFFIRQVSSYREAQFVLGLVEFEFRAPSVAPGWRAYEASASESPTPQGMESRALAAVPYLSSGTVPK